MSNFLLNQRVFRGPGSAGSREARFADAGPPRLVKDGKVVAAQPLPFYLRPQPRPQCPEQLRAVALPPPDASADIDALVGSDIRLREEESWMEPADLWLQLGLMRH